MRPRASHALLVLLAVIGGQRAACAPAALPLMPDPGARDRVLVVAPHPDDESLCCAGLMQHASANGAAVAVVWLTAGEAFELDAMLVEHELWPRHADLLRFGEQRLAEGARAASLLDVPAARQFVLGYPDRGLMALVAGDYHYRRPFRSRYTGLDSVGFAQALSPNAVFNGADLERDLEHVLDEFQPTLVLAAAPQDSHPDHAASGLLLHRLLERRGQLDRLRYWIVHASHWPAPRRYQPQLSLTPPGSAQQLHWQSLPLSVSERAHKLAALRAHRSQMRLTEPFMLSFVRANELFAPPLD
ncbi:MAG TPA: PIG-L deacetylase family protein [Steroidobacteraceae bacterium]|jgi:LmbE family N-acetylglucosaminyl deacetylase